MNGTWLAFLTLLIVALIAVSLGAQQMDVQHAQEINQLTELRDTTVNVALEAKEQRDTAYAEREAAFKVRDEAVAKVADLDAKITALQADLQTAQTVAGSKQAEIAQLTKDINSLQSQVQALQARNVELEAQVAEQQPIPVTNQGTSNVPSQLGLGLVVLIGMAALGSGGYLYYRHDPNRKYSVKMTKDQIREYARYQRERGNRAA